MVLVTGGSVMSASCWTFGAQAIGTLCMTLSGTLQAQSCLFSATRRNCWSLPALLLPPLSLFSMSLHCWLYQSDLLISLLVSPPLDISISLSAFFARSATPHATPSLGLSLILWLIISLFPLCRLSLSLSLSPHLYKYLHSELPMTEEL